MPKLSAVIADRGLRLMRTCLAGRCDTNLLDGLDAPAEKVAPNGAAIQRYLGALCGAVAALGEPAFPLRIATETEIGVGGLLDLALAAAPTVADAFRLYADHGGWTCATRVAANGAAILEWHTNPALGPNRSSMLAAVAYVMSRAGLIGLPAGRGTLVEFGFKAGPGFGDLEDRLQARVRFDAEATRILVPPEASRAPDRSFTPAMFTALQAGVARETAAASQAATMSAHLIDLIERYLHAETPALPVMADAVGLSPRSLQRRLSDEGTDLRCLIEQARRNAALYYLTETTRTVTDIAGRLGFSESSSFGRAARQWFGLSPTEIRAQG